MTTSVKVTKKNISNIDQDSSAIFLPDRDAKIAELAYYKAESRGFEPGFELQDWIEAEQAFSL
jgi:hypothetical protein